LFGGTKLHSQHLLLQTLLSRLLQQPVKRCTKKFNWTLQLIATIDRVPTKFFQHMEGTEGLYEIRVEVGSNIFRAFAFFDKGQMIVVANAFQNKTQKTPKNEIEFAKKIKKEYFHEESKRDKQ